MQSADQATQRAAGLQWLAFLLTEDREPSLDLAVETIASEDAGNSYFSKWMEAWSRRIVIAKALAVVREEVQASVRRTELSRATKPELPGREWSLDRAATRVELERALLAIDLFPRAVLVLSVYEQVPIEDTAVLLDARLDLVRKARALGLWELTRNLARMQGWTAPAANWSCPCRGGQVTRALPA